MCQATVAEWHVRCLFAECIDDIAESAQALIDVRCLLETLTLRLAFGDTLRSGEINQVKLCHRCLSRAGIQRPVPRAM